MSKSEPSTPGPAGKTLTIPAKNLLERMSEVTSVLCNERREVELQIDRHQSVINLLADKQAYLDKLAGELLAADKPVEDDYQPMAWEDALLLDSLRKANWDDLKAKGATDEQIATRLSKGCHWADYDGYSHDAAPHFTAAKDYASGGYRIAPSKASFLIGTAGRSQDSIKLHERIGAALFKDVRRLLSIPQPKRPTKPPRKSPAKPTAKAAAVALVHASHKPSPKKSQAAATASASPKLKQTFHQWRSSVSGILTRKGVKAPPASADEELRRNYYDKGVSAKVAAITFWDLINDTPAMTINTRDEKGKKQPLDLPTAAALAEAGAFIHAHNTAAKQMREIADGPKPASNLLPEKLAGERADTYVDLDDVGISATSAQLHAAYSFGTLESGRIRHVIEAQDGKSYVVVGETRREQDADLYCLHPVVPIDEYPGVPVGWAARRKSRTSGMKMKLEGVFAKEDNTGKQWVFIGDDLAVNVAIDKPGQERPSLAAAAKSAGAAGRKAMSA